MLGFLLTLRNDFKFIVLQNMVGLQANVVGCKLHQILENKIIRGLK